MYTEDGHFIAKCLAGEPEAFGILVDKYKASIYALAYAKLKNFHDAQDMTQEAFLRAYQKLSTFRRTERFLPWLYAITSNLCTNFLRRQSRSPERDFIEDIDEEVLDKPSISAHQDELRLQAIHDALSELPEIYRQVLSLHYLGGMKSREIAVFLRTSKNTIDQRLFVARKKLKEEMIDMMSITFEEMRLQPSFTFRLVEAIKQTKIQAPPSKMTLPLSVSATAGLIVLLLSLSIPYSPLYPIGQLIGSALPSQTQVPEAGVIPVDTIEITEITILTSEKGDGHFGQKPKPEPVDFFGGGGKWERKTDMPTGRAAPAITVNGKIYVIGGTAWGQLGPGRTVEMYDPVTDTWTKKADMPTGRGIFSASVVGENIYAIGGMIFGGSTLPTVEEYNPVTDTWTKKTNMPTPRTGFTAVVNGRIYAIGGVERFAGRVLSTVEEFDPELPQSVNPQGKLTTTWGEIKAKN
ncbi:sigma-70 family RNA polymerase sigma factor [Candidatus Poribacteria bacterium]|nr:sigma-70 family RNA polymerase sigma factor [Candidatus Poribacteria bacterium]